MERLLDVRCVFCETRERERLSPLPDISNAGIPQIANQTIQELDGRLKSLFHEMACSDLATHSDHPLCDYEHHDGGQANWLSLVAQYGNSQKDAKYVIPIEQDFL